MTEENRERILKAAKLQRIRQKDGDKGKWLLNCRKMAEFGWLTDSEALEILSPTFQDAPISWMIAAGLGVEVDVRAENGSLEQYKIATREEWEVVALTLEALRLFPGSTLVQVVRSGLREPKGRRL